MAKDDISKDVFFNLLPLKRTERIYGFLDFLAIQICFGIAAWFFLVGGLTGTVVPAREAIPIVLFGNAFPLFLISPLAVIFARYGVEQFIGSRGCWGHRGTDVWFLIYITSSFGWIAYAAFLFGESAIKVMGVLGASGALTQETPGASIFAFIATFIGLYIAFKGPNVLKWFMRFAAVFMMAILLGFIYLLFSKYGLQHIMSTPPPEPLETVAWSRASAIEWNVGLGFSWAFWYGQWTRLSKSEIHAYHGCQWGWGILAAVAGVFSALTAIVVGSFDPTDWIVSVGSLGISVIGLLLFAIANISSIGTLIYPMSITLRSRFPQVKWLIAILICSIPAFILETTPTVFYSYGNYLAIIAFITGVYGAIMIGDYILTKGNYKLREFYNRKQGYRFWAGFNIPGFVATVAAGIFYLTTINPITWESYNGLFPKITAGLPAYLIALVVYIITAKATRIR